MDTLDIVLLVVAVNWLSPLLLWLYPLTMLLFKKFTFGGFHGPWAKFQLVSKDPWSWHSKLWRGWGGVGLYGFLCYRQFPHRTTVRLVKHEAEHCKHWAILGLSFYFLYMAHMLWIWITQKLKGKPYTRHPYYDCWSERLARRAAGQRVVIPSSDWPGGPDDLWPWW